MKFKSWDGEREIELMDCPFCGGEPKIKHIGNDFRPRKKMEVKCSVCRVKRTDATLGHEFSWLEDVVAKNWNQRPMEPVKLGTS